MRLRSMINVVDLSVQVSGFSVQCSALKLGCFLTPDTMKLSHYISCILTNCLSKLHTQDITFWLLSICPEQSQASNHQDLL